MKTACTLVAASFAVRCVPRSGAAGSPRAAAAVPQRRRGRHRRCDRGRQAGAAAARSGRRRFHGDRGGPAAAGRDRRVRRLDGRPRRRGPRPDADAASARTRARAAAACSCSWSIRTRSSLAARGRSRPRHPSFFRGLTFDDRSALMVMPVGPERGAHVGARSRARRAAAGERHRRTRLRPGNTAA